MAGHRVWVFATLASAATLPFYRLPGGISLTFVLLVFLVLYALYQSSTMNVAVTREAVALGASVALFLLAYFLVISVNVIILQRVTNFSWLLELGAYVAVACVLAVVLSGRPGLVRIGLGTLTAVGVALALFGLWRFAVGAAPWVELVDHANEQGFGTRNSDMFLIWPAAPILAAVASSRNFSKLVRIATLAATVIILSALVLSASRGAVLIGSCSSLVSFYLVSNKAQKIKAIVLVSLTGLFAIIYFADVIVELARGLIIADRIIERLNAGENRLDLLTAGLRAIADAPLLGHGASGAQRYAMSTNEVHFHSSVIQIAAEAGIPVAMTFCVMLVSPIICGLSKHGESRLSKLDLSIGTSLAVGILLQSLVSVFYNWIFFWLAWSVASAAIINPVDKPPLVRSVRLSTADTHA